MTHVTILGIPVTDQDLGRWLDFYASSRHPFGLARLAPAVRDALPQTPQLKITAEVRDTFFLYAGGPWAWLTEEEFRALPAHARTALTRERRQRTNPKPPVAWPSDPLLRAALVRWIEAGTAPSLHVLAREHREQASPGPLPQASTLAGQFPAGSGPNCFATVMAATGQPVARDWVQQEQFERWLAEATSPVTGGSDDEGARVLLWHEHGQLAHAAVTIGGGWVLHKPSQSWSSPTMVWTAAELIRSWRLPGTRLSRRVIRTS